jgi:glycosyltransferase involved in cell wall biosynthesis
LAEDRPVRPPGVRSLIPKLVLLTEIIAPYRIPVFNALAQRNELELHVLFLSENDPSLRQWQVYKDEIQFHYEVLPSWRRRLGKFNALINRGVAAALNRIKPDAILCGGYNYLASWQAAYWAKRHRVPLLVWSESTAFDGRGRHLLVEFLKRRFLEFCSAFVVAGQSSQRYLENLGIAEELIFTAPNAVDTSLFAASAAEARKCESQVRARYSLPPRYFLYVGRLVEAKGIFELLDAYALLNPELRSQVGLVFVGDGADRPELMRKASQIAPGTIQFAGFVHRENLPVFYALADALIFPTHSDPWGLVVNEAMSCSLPVIVSYVAGCAPDLVKNGWNGFIIPPREASQLSTSMSLLASDSGLRLEMGMRSREQIEANSPNAWAEGIVRAMASVSAGTQ